MIPLPTKDEWWNLVDQLVPDHGYATTLQGELLRAGLRISAEFFRNGCGNWSEDPDYFAAMTELLGTHLCDGTFDSDTEALVKEELAVTKRYGECPDCPRSKVDEALICRELDKLELIVTAWCLRHPDLISWQAPNDDEFA